MSRFRHLMLRLGTTCNNSCEHCTIGDLTALPERITEEVLEELGRARAEGCDELTLMRGESTLRPDLVAIVREAHALGYAQVVLHTNGRLLSSPAMLDELRRAGVTVFEVSLYGPTADVHDAVARTAGAFGETTRGITNCVARKVGLLVTVPVVRANVRHLAETVALLWRLGVGAVRFDFMRPLEGGARAVATIPEAVSEVRAAVLLGRHLGLRVAVEALPPCLLGGIDEALLRFVPAPVKIVDLHRTVTDLGTLRRIYRPPASVCTGCGQVADCPVTWRGYLEELHGERHLQPFPAPEEPEVDLCFLHAPWALTDPAVPRQWDLLNLFPDAAPSRIETQAAGGFAEVPVGVESIRRYLEARSGYRVRVVNLAGLYLGAKDLRERVVEHLRGVRAKVFAVDLHWLVHVQGALELLALCRRLHPAARTVVGGLTATHFAREILEAHEAVDFVIVGDGERPMLRLLDGLLRGGDLGTAPNLWYRRHGRVTRSRASYFADEESDYRGQPYVPLRRGCAYDCAHCGVGQTATRAIFGARSRYRYAPEKVASEVMAHCGSGRLARLVGDPILTFGVGGMRRFLNAIGSRGAELDVGVEFQMMHGEAEIERLAHTFRSVRLVLRPDSGDEDVRRRQGKPYSNEELLRCIAAAAARDNVVAAVTFAFGLAGDDPATLDQTLALLRHILALPAQRPIEVQFDELWYLQPGSPALGDPAAYGYRAEWIDLEGFRRGVPAPLFSGVVHFSPGGLSRRQYVELLLRKHEETNRLLYESGRRGPGAFHRVGAYVDVVGSFLDAYERFGPGGAGAPAAEALRLGREMRDAFVERALAAPSPPRVHARSRGAPLAPAPAFVRVPLEGERREAVLRALGFAESAVGGVSGGRGALRVELGARPLLVAPAGSRSSVGARTDCFDLAGDATSVALTAAALQRLEVEQPERLPVLFGPMWERPHRERAADGEPERIDGLVCLTTACNQRCQFCSTDPAQEQSLSPQAIRAFIRRRSGGPEIAFSGGEPTLDRRLPEYLRAARQAGYPEIVLQTNAVRCASVTYARRLAESGLRCAVVSLHSHRARLSDALTRTPGSFTLTLRGIDALLESGVRVWLNFVANARNVGETEAFVRFTARRFRGLTGVCLSLVAPVGDGARVPALWPRLGEVAPHFARALTTAAAAGIPARVKDIHGVPLCFLPGLERFSEALRRAPGGDATRPDRTHPAACNTCRWRGACSGFWREYLARHGEEEFVPVKL